MSPASLLPSRQPPPPAIPLLRLRRRARPPLRVAFHGGATRRRVPCVSTGGPLFLSLSMAAAASFPASPPARTAPSSRRVGGAALDILPTQHVVPVLPPALGPVRWTPRRRIRSPSICFCSCRRSAAAHRPPPPGSRMLLRALAQLACVYLFVWPARPFSVSLTSAS
ncbi:hypothetical protein BRADI_4g40473v3 [Brachypodium distachyon]|uniref:Uncharacterized protein n=1 Tax=Brachypodium distachyon TaxID=15368 RepID=A0A2K2CTH1_BRADI|nr:hypothetical protein BRADI_4g40473v3 [Brachypodium distachyon]